MIYSTDDAAWRLEFVWKGPPESPMPFEARYQAWMLGLVLAPLFALIAYLLLFPLDVLGLHTIIAVLIRSLLALACGGALAVLTVRKFARVVTPTRPMTHHLAVALSELRTPRPQPIRTLTVDVPRALSPGFGEDTRVVSASWTGSLGTAVTAHATDLPQEPR